MIRLTAYFRGKHLSGLASALRLGGRGSIPRPGHTKNYKNGTQWLPTWHSASRVRLGVKSLRHTELTSVQVCTNVHQAASHYRNRRLMLASSDMEGKGFMKCVDLWFLDQCLYSQPFWDQKLENLKSDRCPLI